MSETRTTSPRTAVVTGAGSGIGAATARRLAAEGFHVLCAARREDRIRDVAAEVGGTAVRCDVTSPESVAELAQAVGPRLDVLVNNAGAALDLAPLAEADPETWLRMYDVNALGLMRVTQALLPALRTSGDGVVVNLTSTSGHATYEGGGGYAAAKHAARIFGETLRLELVGEPVRVCEVAPGMVQTDEFSLVRFDGDREKADAVYAGVPGPLTAEDVADAVVWVATRPPHVNIDSMVLRPRAQAAQHRVHRVTE